MDFTARFDPAQLRTLTQAGRRFSSAYERELRRRLQRAADDTAAEMRSTVQSAPGSGRLGIRRAVAAGIRVQPAESGPGIRIASTGQGVPAGHTAMVTLLDRPSWSHPVYGHRGTTVTQTGRPYFGTVIRRHENPLQQANAAALTDTLKEITR